MIQNMQSKLSLLQEVSSRVFNWDRPTHRGFPSPPFQLPSSGQEPYLEAQDGNRQTNREPLVVSHNHLRRRVAAGAAGTRAGADGVGPRPVGQQRVPRRRAILPRDRYVEHSAEGCGAISRRGASIGNVPR